MPSKMITFDTGIDIRCRSFSKPTVAKLNTGRNGIRYIVIGTEYGYIHTTGGDIRVWKSASGAYRAARRYVSF